MGISSKRGTSFPGRAITVIRMYPRVKNVIANNDFTLTIEFKNGEKRKFDMSLYLDFGVFNELKKISYFKQVKPFMGTISWPHGQDICPDTLYMESESSL